MLTDPTYLRYIVDGLDNQTIQQENISALPQGLIGIYEEALPWEQNIKKRGRLLDFFSVWALLKKEVSANLVAHLLNWPEEKVVDEIAVYSKWFNSPTSGTYILYHERLRAFLLKKITSNQLYQTNNKIIAACRLALESRKADEWEIYALEHLPAHLLIPAMQVEEQGANFGNLVYDTSYWNRQLEISKGFDWSKKMLNQALTWAAKQSTDELIECALNKIDLHYMEQNDAPRIVELVAQNDIDTALQRIESFGGNDKEGLQRKFTLYMLCLMELTLLDSKDKPFRKTAIEKLLNHLDENIPVDHSILNWNDYFPSYLMFQMACQWAEMGLDYLRVYKRTDKWEYNWIEEKGPFSDWQFSLLFSCAQNIDDESYKSLMLEALSMSLASQGKIREAMECTAKITVDWRKSGVLIRISSLLATNGKKVESENFLKNAFEIALGISDEWDKNSVFEDIYKEYLIKGKIKKSLECAYAIININNRIDALKNISIELYKQGNKLDSVFILKKALFFVNEMSDKHNKSYALEIISLELAALGIINEALQCARSISIDLLKCRVLKSISIALLEQNLIDESYSVMLEAIQSAREIGDEFDKCRALTEISIELYSQGSRVESYVLIKESITYALKIDDVYDRIGICENISIELAKHGKLDESASITKKAIDFVREINFNWRSRGTIKNIIHELTRQGTVIEALKFSNCIDDNDLKSGILLFISKELSNLQRIEEATFFLKNSLEYAHNTDDEKNKSFALLEIAKELSKQGNISESFKVLRVAIECTKRIIDPNAKNTVLHDISIELVEIENINEAIQNSQNISDDNLKSSVLKNISRKFIKKGNIIEAIKCIQSVKYQFNRNSYLEEISLELIEENKFNEAIEFARKISLNWKKRNLYKNIYFKLANQGDISYSISVIQELLNTTFNIIDVSRINAHISKVVKGHIKNGEIFKARICALEISDENDKCDALMNISNKLDEMGKIKESLFTLKEAYESVLHVDDEYFNPTHKVLSLISIKMAKIEDVQQSLITARSISDDFWKIHSLLKISTELYKKMNFKDSQSILTEVVEYINSNRFESEKTEEYTGSVYVEIAIQDKINTVLEFVNKINSLRVKSKVLKDIFNISYTKVNFNLSISIINQAIENAQALPSNRARINILLDIVKVLDEHNQKEISISVMSDIIKYALDINEIWPKMFALQDIAQYIVLQNNWKLAEYVGFKITQTNQRQICWAKLAIKYNSIYNNHLAFKGLNEFSSLEAQTFYLMGWAKSITVDDITDELVHLAIQALQHDSTSLEHFLQVYAQHELFFGNPSQEKIDRLNKTLNIQWAIDIKESFVAE